MNIEINEKNIAIDNSVFPKGIFSVIAMNDRVRLDFVNTIDKIDIFAPCDINGITYNNLLDIKEVLSDEVFNLRWATSAEVSQMIAEAQLAGQEVDLSVYALKSELTPITIALGSKVNQSDYNTNNATLNSAINDRLNISDWTPYKNEVNSQLNQIADSIRELDEDKVNRNELSNEYTTLELFDNQNALNSANFALKTQLNNYATLDQLTEVIGLKFWATTVNAVNGVWSVTFPSGKFTTPPLVFATAISESGNSSNRANFASVDSVTITGATGMAKRSISAGLLAATEMTNADCQVQILAIQL